MNQNQNKSLGENWLSEENKKRFPHKELYYADSCGSSRNYHHTLKTKDIHLENPEDMEFLPLSGSEPDYEPEKWNSDFLDRINHNCYAYVLNDFIQGRPKRPQPGHRDKDITTFRKQDYTREEITRRAIYDNPSIYCTNPYVPCPKGYYKGVLVIDRYNNYHWLRQDSNGYWSHKPGQLPVTNRDADGKLISNPSKANLVYDKERKDNNLIYTDIGPYFCIPIKDVIQIESHTCGQCGGSIRSNNKNGVCIHCRKYHC